MARRLGTDVLITPARLSGASASIRADRLEQADLIDASCPSRLIEAVIHAARHLVRSRPRTVRDGTQFARVPGSPIPQIRDAVQMAHSDRRSIPDPKFTDHHEHRAQIIAPLLMNRPALARVLARAGVT